MKTDKVNTAGIHVGDVYKSYKELCYALREEVTSSNSKTAQIENWARFFKFRREGRKFIIEEIYDTPLPPRVVKRNKPSEYADLMYPLLLELMGKSKDHSICDSKIKLMERLGFVNSDYYKCPAFQGRKPLDINPNIPLDKIPVDNNNILQSEIHRICTSVINQYFDRGLENLQKCDKIRYEKTYQYSMDDNRLKYILSDSEYKTRIDAAKLDALKKVECKTTAQAHMKGVSLRYAVCLRKILKERYKVHDVQEVYLIKPFGNFANAQNKLRKEYESDDYEEDLYFALIENSRKALNDKMVELTTNAINKAAQEYTEGANTYKRHNYMEHVINYLFEKGFVPPVYNSTSFENAIRKECMDFLNNYIRLRAEDCFYS